MSEIDDALTLNQAKTLIHCLAGVESLLLLSSPGLGKSDIVRQAAAEAGMECRSLLGTQIAPEDVGGVPKVIGERTVFCPPRMVLPDDDRPYCLFLDELPAAPPDVQKAFYSLLLERRLGEHQLPKGSWVIAAGNRTEDRAVVSSLSSALVNRLFLVTLRVDVAGWLQWAERAGVRPEVRAFIHYVPQALSRPVPREPIPFSTPRSWALSAHDLDLAEKSAQFDAEERRAIAFGRLSAEDAGLFCALVEDGLADLLPIQEYLRDPALLPEASTALWFVVSRLRKTVERNELRPADADDDFPGRVNALLARLPQEFRFAVLLNLVPQWADLGASETMLETLKEVAGAMTNDPTPKPVDRYKSAVVRARHALRLVCAEMPHLAGLAHLVRVVPTRYFSVAAVGPTGVLCVNPNLFGVMPMADAAFVLAHELLHLALDTHTRQGDANPHLVNVAHDYVINDMLSAEMGRGVPLNGLVRMGARDESLESLVVDLSKQGGGKIGCWASGRRRGRRRPRPGKSPIREALENAGLVPPESPPPELNDPLGAKNPFGDLLTPEQEQILEPDVTPERRRQLREEIRKAAAKALSLGALRARIDETQDPDAPTEPQRGERLMKALHTAYQPPWQLALQRWLDAVAPTGRSYAKASRRGADRDDGVVLCGRLREGWTLHIVLDTSGSMAGILPNILGVIASFCEGAGVAQAHILQCDIEVTRDEWLEPAQLSEYRIAGFGGSDMSPGLLRLAEDTEVAAALVLTDGYITYPAQEPPYAVLWVVYRDPAGYAANFRPPYGAVTFLDP